MPDRRLDYLAVLPLVCILVLSYCRHTYLLNPNLMGDPFLLDYRLMVSRLGAASLVNIRSILLYWVLFFTGHVIFFLSISFTRKKIALIAILFLIISAMSGIVMALDIFLFPSKVLYNFAASVKNFLLSPVFTAAMFVVLYYFQRISGRSVD